MKRFNLNSLFKFAMVVLGVLLFTPKVEAQFTLKPKVYSVLQFSANECEMVEGIDEVDAVSYILEFDLSRFVGAGSVTLNISNEVGIVFPLRQFELPSLSTHPPSAFSPYRSNSENYNNSQWTTNQLSSYLSVDGRFLRIAIDRDFEGSLSITDISLDVSMSQSQLWKQNGTSVYYDKGNVGIGISIPTAGLDVRSSGVNGTCYFKGSELGSHFNFAGLNENTYIRGGNYTTAHVLICDGTEKHIGGQEMGNVGIGLGSPNEMPKAKLDVGRGSDSKAPHGTAAFRGSNLDYTSYFNWSTTENTYIRGGKANANVLINDLVGLGYVGIGTQNPLAKLHVEGNAIVNGRISTKELLITPNAGKDIVFDSNYKLLSIKELEKFVNTHKHLPEIAPEKEMLKNGVEMSTFQMQLLQKVEELTLYIIEQNKQIETLKKDLLLLKNK